VRERECVYAWRLTELAPALGTRLIADDCVCEKRERESRECVLSVYLTACVYVCVCVCVCVYVCVSV